jgi:hypothetical protein
VGWVLWFLDIDVQRTYALWGGASAHRTVVRERTGDDGGGAGQAFWESVKDQFEGSAKIAQRLLRGPD